MRIRQTMMSTNSADLAATAGHTRRTWLRHGADGRRLAQAACIVGLLFAAVSVYWGLGGTWLLNTLDRRIEAQALSGNTGIYVAVWTAVVLKTTAALLPLLALRSLRRPAWNRTASVLAWLAACFLILYGVVQTTLGLLAIHGSTDVDGRVAWSAYLWDPWFLIWGVLAAAALLRSRSHRRGEFGAGL